MVKSWNNPLTMGGDAWTSNSYPRKIVIVVLVMVTSIGVLTIISNRPVNASFHLVLGLGFHDHIIHLIISGSATNAFILVL